MIIDPKGLSREPASRPAGESCMAGYESVKETLRVSDDVDAGGTVRCGGTQRV
jgi:hypothetical protein